MADPRRVRHLLEVIEEQTRLLRGLAATASEKLLADLVERLKNMARFRNLLVHGYARVDDARVVEILKSQLGDLDEFRQQIAGATDT